VIVVPAFTVGRTQLLLHGLAVLRARGELPAEFPIFLNSPMAIDATALYRRHASQHRLSPAQCEAMSAVARNINTVEQSKELNRRKGPMLIIAGSGMATGGRVVHHLKAFAPDPANAIVLTGFQAGGTRGAALLGGAESIKIHGEYVPVRAKVENLSNLSAHADRDEILAWLKGFEAPPRKVYITHGEPDAADSLRRSIGEQLRWDCIVPDYLQTVPLDAAGP
jgi:metallo-beta-lactamase family protein